MRDSNSPAGEGDWNILCKAGGVAAFLFFIYSTITMIALLKLGGQPATAEEAFAILQRNRLVGLIRLDVLTLMIMPAYYLLFAGLYVALRGAHKTYTTIAAALAFIGVTLFLSTPSVLAMAHLSDQHMAATSEARRTQLVAAGEAIIASDMWHGAGPAMGGILLQAACVLISAVMLQGNVFTKGTAYVGLVTHGLDLAHGLVGLVAPTAGMVLIAVAGPLYLLWFPLVGIRLYELSSRTPEPGLLLSRHF